jgi:hypothetical protein
MSKGKTVLKSIDEERSESEASPSRSSTPHLESGEVLLPDGTFSTLYEIIDDSDRIKVSSMIKSANTGDEIYKFLQKKYPATICRAALNFHGLKHSSDPDYEGAASAAFAPASKEPETGTASGVSTADSVSYREAGYSGQSTELTGDAHDYDSESSG